MKTNNKKIIKTLSLRSIISNRSRNAFAVLAIMLTTVLFTTLFTMSISIVQTMEMETMRQVGTSAHGGLKYLTEEEYVRVSQHPLIDKISYSKILGIATNEELLKRPTEVRYAQEQNAKWGFCYPTVGHMPRNKMEMVTDTLVLDQLGIPHNIGEKVQLVYESNGETLTDEFTLVGYWEGDIVAKASMLYLSKEYVDEKVAGIPVEEQRKKGNYTGVMAGDIMFKDSKSIERNMITVIVESGYDPLIMSYGINWGYMSTNVSMDPTTLAMMVLSLLIITATGYLFIYNIFRISVTKDIRFYGMLKTIGTTSKQIKGIVKIQGYFLSLVGIGTGLIIGYFVGVLFLPILSAMFSIQELRPSFSPYIFVGAAIFSFLTVFISMRKPSRMAAKVSPMEAAKYTGVKNLHIKKKTKKSRGAKVYQLAWQNLLRDKKKTWIVVISISLGITLVNVIGTMTGSFSMEKYLEKNMTSDFIIGHAKYFRSDYRNKEDMPSLELIQELKDKAVIEEEGSVYYKAVQHKLSEKAWNNYLEIDNNKANKSPMEIDVRNSLEKDQTLTLQVYGTNQWLSSQIDIIEGTYDWEEFKTGKYAIISPRIGTGNEDYKASYYTVGDKIKVTLKDGETKTYEVMALGLIPHNISVQYYPVPGFACYLPESEIKHDERVGFINYLFNVKEGQEQPVNDFLENYTAKVEQLMDYRSRLTYETSFYEFMKIFYIIGGFLSFVVALVGVLNFFNAQMTSIIIRKKELAILQSIGMTKKQLHGMLIWEGGYIIGLTLMATLSVGNALTYGIVNLVAGQMIMFEYHFTVLPILLMLPVLCLLAFSIPHIAYKVAGNKSIVQQIREFE